MSSIPLCTQCLLQSCMWSVVCMTVTEVNCSLLAVMTSRMYARVTLQASTCLAVATEKR